MMIRRLLISAFFLLAAIGEASAQYVRPLNLEELTGNADRVVVATVGSVKPGPAQNGVRWPSDVVTVNVVETIKGTPTTELSFRQVGRFENVPRFAPGETVVLFTTAPTAKTGFSSPFGLGQGVFRLSGKTANLDDAIVMNGSQNRFLAKGLKSDKARQAFTRLGFTESAAAPKMLKLGQLKEMIAACR